MTPAIEFGNPPPTPSDEPPIWPMVIAAARCWPIPPKDREALTAVMEARDAFGRRKHGTPLQDLNDRDALQDELEEHLDAAAYAMLGAVQASKRGDTAGMQRRLERCRASGMLALDVMAEMRIAGRQ